MTPDPAPAAEPVGTTPPSLFATLWGGGQYDVFVSRTMDIRQFPAGKGFGDAVWLHEPPAAPVCYFRLTPARLAGLVARLTARRATAAKSQEPGVALDGAMAAKAAELDRIIARDTEALRLLKAEFKARWPEAAKNLGAVVPEDMEDLPRAADCWGGEAEVEAAPVAAAPPLAGPDADLAAWSRTPAARERLPAGPFRPTAYSVVLDGDLWLSRLAARAAGDAPAARDAALARLRPFRATPPPPAAPDQEATARALAARA